MLLSGRWLEIIVAAVCVTVVAATGALMTEIGQWYESLRYPSWRPPNWLFGPAWTVIFILIAVSGVLAWERAPSVSARAWLCALLAVNGVLNVLWSLLFFKLHRPDRALIEVVALWLSILALVVFIGAYSFTAAAFMVPYLIWVAFAAFLNLKVVQLNAPFGA
jgi:benzodiazapine receptor